MMPEVAKYVEDGHQHFAAGRFDEAAEAYLSAIWHNEAEENLGVETYTNLAACHLRRRDYLRAGNALTTALSFEQDDPVKHGILLAKRASVYLMAGRTAAATSDIEVALMSLSSLTAKVEVAPSASPQPKVGRLLPALRLIRLGR